MSKLELKDDRSWINEMELGVGKEMSHVEECAGWMGLVLSAPGRAQEH